MVHRTFVIGWAIVAVPASATVVVADDPTGTFSLVAIEPATGEIGVAVHVGQILFVRDYIAENHEFAAFESDVHQVEIMFECRLADGERPGTGSAPDGQQTGVEWLDLDHFDTTRFYPAALKRSLSSLASGTDPHSGATYFGDVN